MGKGGGTSWPRPAVCLASVPRAQRPRRAAQNPLHEAPIPACAWTGSTLDLATSGLPARSPRPLTGRPGCCTSPGHPRMLPPPAAIPFTPSEGPGPPRTALSRGKAAPSARPPPLRPAAAVQPAVTFSVVRGLTPSACRPRAGVPSASRWVRGTPSSHRRGLGEGRRAARGGQASGSRAPWSWTGRAPPTATASGWGRLSRFSETQLVMGNPRWTVTWCPMAKQAVLFCQGQLTYQELLLKSRRILFCRRSWPCFGSPWARIAILPLGLAGIFIVYLFSALTSHANPKGPARSRGPRVRAAGDTAGGLRQNPLPPRSRSELQLPSPRHPADRPGRFPGAVRVASTVGEASQVLRAPPRCRWPRCRPFASDFAERALGECGLDVHAAAGPDVQQLEAEGPGRPLPLSRPPPHPAGAPTSQQAVKRVGHAKVKREAPVKTKVLEPARESRGSHGSLGATSGSTEPREGAGPCGWRRRPRPRRSAGPREASPSAWPPLALAVLPNPAHGSGTVPSRPGLASFAAC